jgi:hypothetical protein
MEERRKSIPVSATSQWSSFVKALLQELPAV